jgi:hypothetical protein
LTRAAHTASLTAVHSVPLQTSRTLFLALTVGQLMAAGVMYVARQSLVPVPGVGRMVTLVALGFTVVALVMVQVLRMQLTAFLRENRDTALASLRTGRLPGRAHVLLLLQGAVLEMGGLVGSLALLLGGPVEAALLPLTAVTALLWVMPSADNLERLAQD